MKNRTGQSAYHFLRGMFGDDAIGNIELPEPYTPNFILRVSIYYELSFLLHKLYIKWIKYWRNSILLLNDLVTFWSLFVYYRHINHVQDGSKKFTKMRKQLIKREDYLHRERYSKIPSMLSALDLVLCTHSPQVWAIVVIIITIILS